MPPAKLNRLLGIPILGGIVRRKVMKALGLDRLQVRRRRRRTHAHGAAGVVQQARPAHQ
jgi:hypothetical protein